MRGRGRAATQTSHHLEAAPPRTLDDHPGLDEMHIESVLLSKGNPATRRSTVDLGVRQQTGALIVAVRRRGELIAHPDPRVAFEPGDIVYLVGSLPSIEQAMVRARGPGRGRRDVTLAAPPR